MHRVAAVSICMIAALSASAVEYQPIGVESMSMGGAGVASARGSYAAYYNPALLALPRRGGEIAVTAGFGYRERGLGDAADAFSDISIDDIQDELDPVYYLPGDPLRPYLADDIDTAQRALSNLSDQNELELFGSGAVSAQIGNFGFGMFANAEIAAMASIDKTHLDFIFEGEGGLYPGYDAATRTYQNYSRADYEARSIEYALDNGLSYVDVKGVVYTEIPVAYGYLFKTAIGPVAVGGAFKLIPGYTLDIRIDDKLIDQNDNSDEDFDWQAEVNDSSKDEVTWGVDAGVALCLDRVPGLTLAAAARNINTPSFTTVLDNDIDLEPQVRIGAAYDCWEERITLAADAELLAGDRLLSGEQVQYAGGGVSLHPASWFSVRTGLMTNIKDSGDGMIFTGGLGFGLKWFQLDISGQYASESSEVDGTEIPAYARAQVGIVSKWY